jgi:hypothetical protein
MLVIPASGRQRPEIHKFVASLKLYSTIKSVLGYIAQNPKIQKSKNPKIQNPKIVRDEN